MHALRLALLGFVCIGALAPVAWTTTEGSSRRTATGSSPILVAAQQCPAGYHWESGHYAKHGKWRDPGCWPN